VLQCSEKGADQGLSELLNFKGSVEAIIVSHKSGEESASTSSSITIEFLRVWITSTLTILAFDVLSESLK
jgi:hypothetical protein